MKYDFEGWATKNDVRCADGRIIRRNAFLDNDGKTVPIVWNHDHTSPGRVLGHALLQNRPEGVYAYGTFNDSKSGQDAKRCVEHGDIRALSICAGQLIEDGSYVNHGVISEVSLVMGGANPEATITNIMRHSADGEWYPDPETAIIFAGYFDGLLAHSDEPEEDYDYDDSEDEEDYDYDDSEDEDDSLQHSSDSGDESVGDVLKTLNKKQRDVVNYLIGLAASENDEKEGDTTMKHSVFDSSLDNMGITTGGPGVYDTEGQIMHVSEADMTAIIDDAKQMGSMKAAVLKHGIDQVDWLFPDAKNPLSNSPFIISRQMEWVDSIMNGAHHTPFSRVKSLFADITEDEARAKGYIKGKQKKEEVFGLLRRVTTPTTVYKLQKMDRDDVIDITEFEPISWLKTEMRLMLNEEVARAILISDGRSASSEDKIKEDCIRPIALDADLYNIKATIPTTASSTAAEKAKNFITTAIRARKQYRGSGNPTLFTTEDSLNDILLLEDNNGRIIYDSMDKVKNILRVSNIVTVPVMEGAKGPNKGTLAGIIVNMADYNIGADKGGSVNMFDDFDLNFNKYEYLIETRCSGALIRPYSAITLEYGDAPASSEG